MADYTYRIEGFAGLDQSRDENLLSPAYSPDAMNVDTENGDLAVTKGFSKLIPLPVPRESTSGIDRVCFFRSASGDIPMAISGGYIYTYSEAGGWTRAYEYSLVPEKRHYSVLMTRIGMTDTMLIADGVNRIVKFDGSQFSDFGSQAGCSDIPVGFIAMYRGRLFAAGSYEDPNRLYYSKLPGGSRTIEDWGSDPDSPQVEGGHIEIGTTSGDPITAVCAMSNQLLIFKRSSVYRLIGDRPGNFTVELIEKDSAPVTDTATAVCHDVIYYVTRGGLHSFSGVDVSPLPDSRRIKRIMQDADVSDTRMAAVGSRLYFTIRKDGASRLIEYDPETRRYMQYGGFGLYDICAHDGSLIITNSARYLEKWGEGSDFDGQPIRAYWRTPTTDLGEKSVVKTLGGLYLRGASIEDAPLLVKVRAGGVEREYRSILPCSETGVLEIPLKDEGRTFGLTFENENGGRFCIVGGVEMSMSVRKRTV